MKIVKFINQNRRDFCADYQCEGCGHVEYNQRGYDDRNFHDNIIPNMKCNECNKSRNDLGIISEVTETKYQPWEII